MFATSAVQSAAKGRDIPPADEVRAGIWALPVPVEGSNIPYAIIYAIADDRGRVHLIDAGAAGDSSIAALHDGLRRFGKQLTDVASVTLTHLHRDHLGLAEQIRQEAGAQIAMSAEEQRAIRVLVNVRSQEARMREAVAWGVPEDHRDELVQVGDAPRVKHLLVADHLLEDGDIVDISGHHLNVLATPGHTSGHICLADAADGILFTGDHVLPTLNPGIGTGALDVANPVLAYESSLSLLSSLDEYEVCPGHGFRFRSLGERRRELLAHFTRRTEETAAALAETPDGTPWAVAQRLSWSGGWGRFRGFFLRSALAQTAMHLAIVRGEPWSIP